MSDEALAAYAARLRELKKLAPAAAKEAAPLIEQVIKQTAAAGTDIDGNPWPPRRDGKRALPRAAEAVSAVANGVAVIVTLLGAYVYHHRSKGKDARPILPDSGAGLPSKIRAAMEEGAKRAFQRVMRG